MLSNTLNFSKVSNEFIKSYLSRLHLEYEKGKVGYYHLPDTMMPFIEQNANFCEKTLHEKSDVVVVGVGGSSLGTKALSSMLTPKENAPKIHFLDNLDEKLVNATFKKIELKKTIFFIISKSGTTLETIALLKIVLEKLQQEQQEISKHLAIITDRGSSLEEYAKENSIQYFTIPKNVGGRFSVFSLASLVPLGVCGYDIASLLEGARRAKENYLVNDDDTILQKAYQYAINYEASINVLFSYNSSFKSFNDWYVQLWAESLGKKLGYSRVGLTPVGLIGSSDQHSFLQLVMEGPKDKSVTFIKIKKSANDIIVPDIKLDTIKSAALTSNYSMQTLLNMQCDATMQSVMNEGILTDMIELDVLDDWHAGYLMYYFMLLTSTCGIMLGINTYNQPGVEVGKNILKAMLRR